MKIYDSLTKSKREFQPIEEKKVSMYHCGPTVYDHVHIGNLRSFILADFTRRCFEFLGYEVKQVMNITDVGHLITDGDHGDDKMTKALVRKKMDINLDNMLEIANHYSNLFIDDLATLNIKNPHFMPKASNHIKEDIILIEKLEQKEFVYITNDGVYFDTSKMTDYGKLGGVVSEDDNLSRIVTNTEKKQSADFALWKFNEHHGWESPWGKGFPGWHIECSGMAIKYLGTHFDIHTGGSDLKSIHHNNEIAQSECSTGVAPFVNYWVHGEMLNFGGAKLSKSTGGNIRLSDIKDKGLDVLAYRYLTLQTHYRNPMNFTWEVLESAQNSLNNIHKHIIEMRSTNKKGLVNTEYLKLFEEKISDDMNIPQALAVFHDLLKSDIENEHKLATIYCMDEVFGLDLENYKESAVVIPSEVTLLLEQRDVARKNKDWDASDKIREKIDSMGYIVSDDNGLQNITKK